MNIDIMEALTRIGTHQFHDTGHFGGQFTQRNGIKLKTNKVHFHGSYFKSLYKLRSEENVIKYSCFLHQVVICCVIKVMK